MRVVLILLFILNFGFSTVFTKRNFDVSMFPKLDDFKQHIITLKPQKNESNFRVEIVFGKDKIVDCNYYFLLGPKLEELDLQGWGYKFYKFSGKDEIAGTRKMCHARNSKKFIKYNEVLKLDYNSKLPIVIYVKDDIKIEISVFKKIEGMKK